MNNSDRGKCLTCEYWGGNTKLSYGADIEQSRGAKGKCFDKSSNNPKYYNGEHLSSDDGCPHWSKHPSA